MMTVPPASAQVDSSTSDGMAMRLRLQPRVRPEADPAEDGVEHAVRARRRRRASTAVRRPRAGRHGQVRERGVEALAPAQTSLISTAATSGIGIAEDERQQRELDRCCGPRSASSGSAKTAAEVVEPDPGRRIVRGWCAGTPSSRPDTIGYHENAAKIRTIGSAKIRAERPPPRTHVAGVRRRRGCARDAGRAVELHGFRLARLRPPAGNRLRLPAGVDCVNDYFPALISP